MIPFVKLTRTRKRKKKKNFQHWLKMKDTYVHGKIGIIVVEALDCIFGAWRCFGVQYRCNTRRRKLTNSEENTRQSKLHTFIFPFDFFRVNERKKKQFAHFFDSWSIFDKYLNQSWIQVERSRTKWRKTLISNPRKFINASLLTSFASILIVEKYPNINNNFVPVYTTNVQHVSFSKASPNIIDIFQGIAKDSCKFEN